MGRRRVSCRVDEGLSLRIYTYRRCSSQSYVIILDHYLDDILSGFIARYLDVF